MVVYSQASLGGTTQRSSVAAADQAKGEGNWGATHWGSPGAGYEMEFTLAGAGAGAGAVPPLVLMLMGQESGTEDTQVGTVLLEPPRATVYTSPDGAPLPTPEGEPEAAPNWCASLASLPLPGRAPPPSPPLRPRTQLTKCHKLARFRTRNRSCDPNRSG